MSEANLAELNEGVLSAKRSVSGEITLIQLQLGSKLPSLHILLPSREKNGAHTHTGKVQVNRVSASSDATLNVPP